jgi:uncharacterized membrane protein
VTRKRLYLSYCVIGALYLLVKIAFVAGGYLHPGAIAHGAVPAAVTVAAGILAARSAEPAARESSYHRLMLVLPVLIFVITPAFMYLKQGSGRWLADGRSAVLVIYECLALGQIALAVVAARGRATGDGRSRADRHGSDD